MHSRSPRDTQFRRVSTTQEYPTHTWAVPAVATTTVNVQQRAFTVVFGSLLFFCTGEHCMDLHVVIALKDAISSYKQCPTSGIRRWEKKNRMRQHKIFRSYCRYYGSYYYRMMIAVMIVATLHGYNDIVTTFTATVMMTVVMTVVTENHMQTHTIFFLMSDARYRATIFFFNRIHFAHRV